MSRESPSSTQAEQLETPTWNELGQLTAIIVLRTVLNYFLQKEIGKAGRGKAR